MKRRTVRILRRAEHDLREIHGYLARDAPQAAGDVLDRLLDAMESLDRTSERGARPRDPRLRELGYRYLVVDPYLVFYKVFPKAVRVYRVVHGAQRYADLL